ncbi:hypothetical protein ACFL2Q_18245 [Thermodesulfobacteriota bacterium]
MRKLLVVTTVLMAYFLCPLPQGHADFDDSFGQADPWSASGYARSYSKGPGIMTRMKLDVYYGGGNITPDLQGDGALSSAGAGLYEDIWATDLSDTYVSLQMGVGVGMTQLVTANVETNMAGASDWWQRATARDLSILGFGKTVWSLFGNKDAVCVVKADGKKKWWAIDASLNLPLLRSFDFMAGYKSGKMASRTSGWLAPAPGVSSSAGESGDLTGQVAGASSLSIDSSLWARKNISWHGPFLGGRIKNLIPLPAIGMWHIDLVYAPYLVGNYEFAWDSAAGAGGPTSGWSARTDATGWQTYCIEARGRASMMRLGPLSVDFFGKYSHMRVAGAESQRRGRSTGKHLTGGLTQSFWGVGGGLTLLH